MRGRSFLKGSGWRRAGLLVGFAVAVGVASPLALSAARIVGFSDVPPSNANYDAIDRVTNLNADKLDGLDGSNYLPVIQTFSGWAGNIPSYPDYVFAGPTVTVTTGNGDRITGAAEAPLGTASPPVTIDYGLCYQSSTGG